MTFTQWARRRPRQRSDGRDRVILWPDTFNNHFHPQTAVHAVRALERAGFSVDVPQTPLCCGRPLFDYGLLTTAKAWLTNVLGTLDGDIAAGVPIVGLEPSCVAVFRDELRELLPRHENARRLSRQVFLLSEFLRDRKVALPSLHRDALVHGHCHHKAVMKFDAEQDVLRDIGLNVRVLESGCCGMAGSFGFERGHYDISMKVGERVLLPEVRSAPSDELVVANGFSCRTQIAQATRRRALHLADVLEMAAVDGVHGPAGDFPERRYVTSYEGPPSLRTRVAVAGAAIGIGAAAYALLRRD
jgi:Fe-S oxidoreductase